ncbi:rhodanese-like domain-containing protein [Ferrimonas pelagia]|uniref:Rhodanese-like domain-containing protein n=1 Tax=Ferrimonas pelagia TaxID=1177826 RepID=A0ABP9FKH3_9GAMM
MKRSLVLMLSAALFVPTGVVAKAQEKMSVEEYRALLEAEYATKPQKISLREAHAIWESGKALFFDVNTPELWDDGHVPGATFINTADWESKLPEEKDQLMVFYCANRMCLASDYAAEAAWELGYTNIKLMPDGIYNWRRDGYPFEVPKQKMAQR